MSLKNQQLLLSNPLDFSVDFSQGFSALFRSYIELFTQYHFGTYLLNSAIVSVATVAITLFFAVPGAYAVARLRFPGQNFLSQLSQPLDPVDLYGADDRARDPALCNLQPAWHA